MLKIQSILVPTDLSVSARSAFALGRGLGRHFEAAIHVLHVKPPAGQFASLSRWFSSGLPEPDAERIQAELSQHYGGYDRLKYVEREGSSVADTILDYVEDCRIDLVVMSTHGHRSLEHPALGGAAGEVVRRATSHVVTIRARAEEERPFSGIDRIVVGIDFAEDSSALVRGAKQIASLYGASVTLVFVSEEHNVPFFSDTGIMTVTTLKVDEEIAAHAGVALHELDRETGSSDVQVDYVVRHGKPARELVGYADDAGADLVIVGRRGHSSHEGLILGSVTEHVVRTSPCPVLTMRPNR